MQFGKLGQIILEQQEMLRENKIWLPFGAGVLQKMA